MKKQEGIAIGVRLLCLLGAVLLSGCGGKTEPPVKTDPDSAQQTTARPADPAKEPTTKAPTEEVTTGREEVNIPTVDIETTQAKNKTLVGKTDKNPISYQVGETMTFTIRLDADGKHNPNV